jgi:CBS domain-containing protein
MIRLRDIMTAEVVTIDADASLRDAMALLRDKNVTGVPVLEGSRVVGVVGVADILDFEVETPPVPAEMTSQVEWGGLEEEVASEDEEEELEAFYTDMWDDAGADVVERFAHDTSPEWDLLSEHTVEEVMTQTLFRLPPDTELSEAARYMIHHGIHRVLVMEEDDLLGIVTSTDFVRVVAKRRV